MERQTSFWIGFFAELVDPDTTFLDVDEELTPCRALEGLAARNRFLSYAEMPARH